MYEENWPVLVVCPSSARHHWQSEILSLLSPDYLSCKNAIRLCLKQGCMTDLLGLLENHFRWPATQ